MSVSILSNNRVMNYGLPCSFTGALFALSGIDGIDVLVNGPSSCTGFATGLLDGCHPLRERNSAHFSRLAVSGHPRIPCSEITDTDVILGVGDKLVQSVELLTRKRSCECIAIVNSCSLSLIGEDASNILKDHPLSDKILYLESTGCSKTVARGFTETIIKLIEKVVNTQAHPEEKTVNILGLPISQYSWKHDIREIQRLMALAGLKVNTVLAARSSLDEIRQLLTASLNIVLNPDYGLEIARFLKKRHRMPYIASERMPIGFDATRKLMDEVLDFFNLSAMAALDEEERRCRKEAVLALSHSQRTDLIRGLPVAIFGEWAFVSGLSLFLKDYLGCCPVILGIEGREKLNPEEVERLQAGTKEHIEILLNPDSDAVMAAINTYRPAITFGSAFEEYLLTQIAYSPKFFIQTTPPGFNRTNLVYRPYIGFTGALTFMDDILNCKLTNQYPYAYD